MYKLNLCSRGERESEREREKETGKGRKDKYRNFDTLFVETQKYSQRLVVSKSKNKCGKVSVHLSLSNSIYTQCLTVYNKFTYNIAFFILENNK